VRSQARSYSDTHGWYSALGATAKKPSTRCAATLCRSPIGCEGDLDGIEAFDHLGEATKWKIAFHYQNRQQPVIVDIFKRAPLAAFTGGTASQSMAALQQAALAKRPRASAFWNSGGRCGRRGARRIWRSGSSPTATHPTSPMPSVSSIWMGSGR
jgi:hypothetical protein